jgi:site-specific DNA recombinase
MTPRMNIDPICFSDATRLTVLYYRTSTNSQHEEMQIAAAHALVQNLGLQNIIEFNDHGVSANKVPLPKRLQLNKVLDLIKQRRVENLVVFARDRLARDTYEYSEILSVLYNHDVNVYFTMQNTPAFRRDRVFELIYSTFCENEGKQISNRTQEFNKRFPPHIYGYRKVVKENEKTYVVDDSKAIHVIDLFHECQKVGSLEEFIYLLSRYSKIIKRHAEQLLNMLQNPFYTGHMEHGGKLLKLNHVEPMLPIELFQNVREKAEVFGKEILDAFMRPDYLSPLCALCGGRMKLLGRSIVSPGRFICRNNHPSVSIQADELENETKSVLKNFIDNISANSIDKITRKFLQKQLEQIEIKLQKLYNAIDDEYIRFCLDFSPMDTGHSIESKIELIKGLENERFNYLVKKYNTEIILQEIDRLVSLLHNKTKRYLDSAELEILSRLVIESIRVSPEELHFNLFFKDLMKKEVI